MKRLSKELIISGIWFFGSLYFVEHGCRNPKQMVVSLIFSTIWLAWNMAATYLRITSQTVDASRAPGNQ